MRDKVLRRTPQEKHYIMHCRPCGASPQKLRELCKRARSVSEGVDRSASGLLLMLRACGDWTWWAMETDGCSTTNAAASRENAMTPKGGKV